MYQTYTQSQKNNLVNQYTYGSIVSKLAGEHSIPKSTLYYWIKQSRIIKRNNGNSITAREVYLLEKKLERAKIENAILKKADCPQNATQAEKIKAVERLSGKYPVRAICRLLAASRSSYYHQKYRSPEKTQIEIYDEIYKPIVKRIFDKTKGRIGPRKIKALMELENHYISERRVARLMKEQNLACVANRKFRRYNHAPKAKYHKNLLDRNFNVDKPNKVWVSDITTVYVNYQSYYICTILDLFSRKVVGYSIGNHQETSLIELAFNKAIQNRNPDKGLIFHSDQGMQYTSFQFRKLLREFKIKQSFSAAGCPYDNAVAESFFRHLKSEQVYPTYYPSYNSFKESIDEYIKFFNNERPHYSLSNRTPNNYEELYYTS